MGLLDDLEQQAQKERDGKEAVQKRQREFFKETTIPVMEGLYDYLTRLSKTLNFLKQARHGKYNITGYGQVVTRIDNDMNVQAQMPMYARVYTVTVTGVVDPSQSPVITIEGAGRIDSMIELFRRYGFEALQKADKNEKGEYTKGYFQAWGKVQMVATFTAEMNSDLLRMEFTNFDSFGVRKQTVKISDLNDDLMDSIGKYIALQQDYIVREKISEEHREAWRAKLQQETSRRDWEQKIAEEQRAEEERLKKQQSGGRITGSIKAITAEVIKQRTGEVPAVKETPPASSGGGLLGKIGSLFGRKDK